MTKWIRWKGLIPFVIIVGLIAAFFVFFIDTLIKWSIEASGTSMVGAKVELQSAKFTFSPLGVRLRSLQVTNPDKPMQNIVDIDNIAFNLDGGNLLLRKVIIEEMTVDNVRLNTNRKTSGAIKKKASSMKKPTPGVKQSQSAGTGKNAAAKEKAQDISMPAFATPDVKQILAREKLKTPELADKFKADTEKTKQEWQNISSQLPTQQRLDSHKQRLNNLKSTNTKDYKQLAIALKEIDSIRNDISSDIKQVNAAKHKISGDFKRLNGQLKELKNSPKEEYKRLLGKYSLSESGVGNISHLLFGDQAKEYTALAMEWYKKLSPYLERLKSEEEPEQVRHKGVHIRFREDKPMPNFLIKTVRASVNIPAGKFKGRILDITSEQDITGKPTTLSFTGDKLSNNMSLLLTGQFNHIKPDNPVDTLIFKMKNYKLDDHQLVNTDDMNIFLKHARSDMNITAGRVKERIHANGKVHIHSIKYNNSASGNDAAKLFLGAIDKTRDFNIIGKLTGTLDDYSTKVNSDLDDRIKGNLRAQFKQQKEKYKQELKRQVDDAVREPVEKAEQEFNQLKKSVTDDINARKAKLNQQLAAIKTQANQYKAGSKNKQDKLKQKAKDKLKNLFK